MSSRERSLCCQVHLISQSADGDSETESRKGQCSTVWCRGCAGDAEDSMTDDSSVFFRSMFHEAKEETQAQHIRPSPRTEWIGGGNGVTHSPESPHKERHILIHC